MELEKVWGCMTVVGIIMLVVVLILGGVYRTEVTYVVPGAPDIADTAAGGVPFEETLNSSHWLGGLIKGSQPDLQQALRKYVREGERVTRLTIGVKHSVVDVLLTGVTLTIYAPTTVTVRGTISKLSEPARR
jgi:hypothetical protein